MTEHTKEPWFHDGDAVYSNADCVGDPIAHVLSCAYDNDLNNIDARRIVAAVNACAGLSTDLLEKAAITAAHIEARERLSFCTQQIEAERDQLLAALETLVEAHDTECSDTDRRWALVDARLAIAAVKGD